MFVRILSRLSAVHSPTLYSILSAVHSPTLCSTLSAVHAPTLYSTLSTFYCTVSAVHSPIETNPLHGVSAFCLMLFLHCCCQKPWGMDFGLEDRACWDRVNVQKHRGIAMESTARGVICILSSLEAMNHSTFSIAWMSLVGIYCSGPVERSS